MRVFWREYHFNKSRWIPCQERNDRRDFIGVHLRLSTPICVYMYASAVKNLPV